MTRTLLVAPTGHGVGLTAVCLGLLQGLPALEQRVQVRRETDRGQRVHRLNLRQPPRPGCASGRVPEVGDRLNPWRQWWTWRG